MLKLYPKLVLITTLSLIGLSTTSLLPAQSIELSIEPDIESSPRNYFVKSPCLEAA